ncbi:MAG: DUF4157 domain-containing protein [Anaerolineaceae bacterium]|nr:DUF4157 domain-containing protein [Anaerolineaceae bacterium]
MKTREQLPVTDQQLPKQDEVQSDYASRAVVHAAGSTPPPQHPQSSRTGTSQFTPLQRSILQLQYTHGNRYVQRMIARQGVGQPDVDSQTEQAIHQSRGQGQILDNNFQRQMESAFDTNFNHVRVHTDGNADTLNRSLSARAFTTGADIYFRQGEYNSGSSSGRELLAHELTHVVQQRGAAPQTKLTVNQPGDQYEQEADAVAGEVMKYSGTVYSGVKAASSADPAVSIQRAEEDSWFSRKLQAARKTYEKIEANLAEASQVISDKAGQLKEAVKAQIEDIKQEAKTTLTEIQDKGVQAVAEAKLHQAQKAAANLKNKATHAVKQHFSKSVMEKVGMVKGVILEGATLLDSIIWLNQQLGEATDIVVESAIPELLGKLRKQKVNIPWSDKEIIDAYKDYFSWKKKADLLQDAGLAHRDAKTSELDISLAGTFSRWADEQAGGLEKTLGVEADSTSFFTPYEVGELEGALGAQVALAFVGAEEAQLVIKGLGAVGAIKGLVHNIHSPDAEWYNIALDVLNIVMSFVGLSKAAAGQKIIKHILKVGAFTPLIIPLKKLYNDYFDPPPELKNNPTEHEKTIHEDAKAIVKITTNIIVGIVHAKMTGAQQGSEAEGKETSSSSSTPKKSSTSNEAPVEETNTTNKSAPSDKSTDIPAEPPVKSRTADADLPVVEEPTATKKSTSKRPNVAEPEANTTLSPEELRKAFPPDRIDEGFTERAYFSTTGKKMYIVRAGGPGGWGDHLFETPEAALQYAKYLSGLGEAAIREKSALPYVWKSTQGPGNPVDRITVWEVPPKTAYMQGVVAPQPEGQGGSAKVYEGQGPQVAIDSRLRFGPENKLGEFPVEKSPPPNTSSSGSAPPPAAGGQQTPPAADANSKVGTGSSQPQEPTSNQTQNPTNVTAPPRKVRVNIEGQDRELSSNPTVEKRRVISGSGQGKGSPEVAKPKADYYKKVSDTIAEEAAKRQEIDDAFDAAQEHVLTPEKNNQNEYKQPSVDEAKRLQNEQDKPTAGDKKAAKVAESADTGVQGGKLQAEREGIKILDWDNPRQYIGKYGKGIDAVGERNGKVIVVEFKGESSQLAEGQMSNEWVGKKIAELHLEGDHAMAQKLLDAARDGKLQGVVYKTKDVKGELEAGRVKGRGLERSLPNENISDSGLIQYAPTKVVVAYQERLVSLCHELNLPVPSFL